MVKIVAGAGLEPARDNAQGILSPSCLNELEIFIPNDI